MVWRGATKRPMNSCQRCGDTWHPRGRDVSHRCPRCGSSSIVVIEESIGLGATGCGLALLIILLAIGLSCSGLCLVGNMVSDSETPPAQAGPSSQDGRLPGNDSAPVQPHPPQPDRVPKLPTREQHLSKVAGRWRVTSRVLNGEQDPTPPKSVWKFADERLSIDNDDNYRVVLDSSHSPPRMEVIHQEDGREMTLYRCIFKLDRQRLILCVGVGADYPNAFTAGKDDLSVILTLER
jgi:uncharacterized protein (TIGR03067 family)